jgi:hypothetical protein
VAIRINFNNGTIYKPGYYGPPRGWYVSMDLINFLHNLGVKTFVRQWHERQHT